MQGGVSEGLSLKGWKCFWCNPARSLWFTVSLCLRVTAFASLSYILGHRHCTYTHILFKLMCTHAHTHSLQVHWIPGRTREWFPSEKCNCIGVLESNTVLMEPNYCCFASSVSSRYSRPFHVVVTFCLEGVQLNIFGLSLRVCHSYLLYCPPPSQTQIPWELRWAPNWKKGVNIISHGEGSLPWALWGFVPPFLSILLSNDLSYYRHPKMSLFLQFALQNCRQQIILHWSHFLQSRTDPVLIV